MRWATYLGLVIRRIWARRLMLLGTFLGATLVTALLIVLPLFEASVSAVDLLFTFRQAPDAVVDLSAVQSSTEYTAAQAETARETVGGASAGLTDWYGEFEERSVSRELVFIPLGFPNWLDQAEEWREDGADPDEVPYPRPPPEATQARFFTSPDVADRVELVEGALIADQRPTTEADPILQVVLGDTVARLTDLGVGDRVILKPFASVAEQFEVVEVSGIARAADPAAIVWEGVDPGRLIYVTADTFNAWATLFPALDREADPWLRMERGFDRISVTQTFTLHLDREAVTLENVFDLRDAVDHFARTVGAAEGIRTETRLDQLVEEFDVRTVVFGVPILAMLALVVAGALYFLVYMAALALERESEEIALMRMRGATPWQTVGIHLLQSSIIAVAAAVAAPFVARAMVALAGRIPPMSTLTGGEPLAVAQTRSIVPFAVVGGALTFASMGLAILPMARRSVLELRALASRPARKSVWQRYNIDIFLVVLAGFVLYELRARGLIDTGGEEVGLDPFAVASPALFLFAGALLLLRLLPLLLRVVGWLMTRTRGMAAALPGWHLGRNPIPYGRLALLVWLTTGFGAFALTYARTLEASYDDRAAFASGGDARIIGDGVPYLEAPEGSVVTPVYRGTGAPRLTSRQAELLAIRPSDFVEVVAWRSDYGDGSPAEVLGSDVLGEAVDWGVELSEGAHSLVAEGLIIPAPWEQRAALGSHVPTRLMVRIVDDVGRFRVFSANTAFDDLRWNMVSIPLGGSDALNGPFDDNGGLLTLQSVWLESDAVTGSTVVESDLLVASFRAVGPGGSYSIMEAVVEEFEEQEGFRIATVDGDAAARAFFRDVPEGIADATDTDIATSPLTKADPVAKWTVPARTRSQPVPHLAVIPERLRFVADHRTAEVAGLALGDETLFGVAATQIEGVVAGMVDLVPTTGDARHEGVLVTRLDGLRQWVSGAPSWSLSGAIARTLEADELWISTEDTDGTVRALRSAYGDEFEDEISASGVSSDFSSRPIQVGLVSILLIGTGAGVVLAVAGVTGYVVEAVRRRHREMGVLRALGFRRSGVAATFAMEQLVVLGVGAVIGVGAGLALMRLMIPFLQLGEEGADLIPPALLHLSYGRLGIYLAVVALMLVASVLWITRSVSARRLSEVLREVEG
jgi:hypothetical protein